MDLLYRREKEQTVSQKWIETELKMARIKAKMDRIWTDIGQLMARIMAKIDRIWTDMGQQMCRKRA